jgi:hypothetical protein
MWLDRASAFAPRPRPFRDLGTERAGLTGLTWFLRNLGDRPAGPESRPILFMSSALPCWPPDNTARAVVLIRWDSNRTGEYRATLSSPPARASNATNGSPPSLARLSVLAAAPWRDMPDPDIAPGASPTSAAISNRTQIAGPYSCVAHLALKMFPSFSRAVSTAVVPVLTFRRNSPTKPFLGAISVA